MKLASKAVAGAHIPQRGEGRGGGVSVGVQLGCAGRSRWPMGCSQRGVTRQSTWGVVIHVDAAVSVVHDVAVNLVRGDVRSCCEVRVL